MFSTSHPPCTAIRLPGGSVSTTLGSWRRRLLYWTSPTHAGCSSGISPRVVVDGRVVAVAHNGASSQPYGDISAATLKSHRRLGYANSCAGLVARWVYESDRTPVWCTNDDNVASMRTADAIGFRQIARRQNVYLKGPG
jgi:hypothetical protein